MRLEIPPRENGAVCPMAVTAQRRLVTQDVRKFGSGRESFDIPDLTQIQTESYERFLQYNGVGSTAEAED